MGGGRSHGYGKRNLMGSGQAGQYIPSRGGNVQESSNGHGNSTYGDNRYENESQSQSQVKFGDKTLASAMSYGGTNNTACK